MGDAFRSWFAEAVRPRLVMLRQVPRAGRGLLATLLLLNLLLGLLPVAFVLASGVVVGRVPQAVAGGVGSSGWEALVRAFLLAAAAFLAQQLLAPVQAALGELVKRRVDGWANDRILGSALAGTGIGPLEDQPALNALAEVSRWLEAGRQGPGAAAAGMLAMVARYTRLAGLLVIVAVVLSWPAALALLVTVLVFRYGQQGSHRRYGRIWARIMPTIRRSQYLRGLAIGAPAAKELRIFGLAGWFGDRYQQAYLEWMQQIWRERRRIYLYPYLWYTAFGLLVTAAVLLVLARRAAAGEIPLTELVLGLQAVTAVLLLGDHYPEADLQVAGGSRAMLGIRRFEELAAAGQPTPGATAAGPVEVRAMPRQEVRFAKVSFHYPGSDRAVLDGLELRLPAGLCTAVVGVNGAGKTTLVKLLTRLHEPTAGAVLVDGVDVRELEVEAWRRQVSVIFQDFVRYELPALDNVALGAVEAPADRALVAKAAAAAGILDTLEALPLGLDSPLSRSYPGGAELSGGQWQRVAIARSLYALQAGASVLVLDEPTAALDVRAEVEFFDHFVELTRGVTSLLISHRFSSVRRADRIVVIDGGRVVEEGDHDSLLAADGHYARLFRLQALRFEEGLDAEEDDR